MALKEEVCLMFSAKLVLALALAGAARDARPAAPVFTPVRVRGRSYVSAKVMMRLVGLRLTVDEKAGIYNLVGGGRRIVVVPGFNVAEVDGQVVDLRYPAIFHRGEMLLPLQLFSSVGKRRVAPSPASVPLRSVVLDPGHGGRDSGAVGRGGLREKDVALSVALRLKGLLEARGVRVTMTRSGDRFVPLLERSRIANRSKADLFLSIHCNASRNRSVGGLETFALSWGISDAYRAGKAAARHRPDDLVDGAASYVGATAEKTIFRAHMSEQRRRSCSLARCLQGEMSDDLPGNDRGVKLRNFSVLRETYVPAALVEVGFISCPSTERKMRLSSYRGQIAKSLLDGLQRYARSEKLRLDRIAGRAAPGPDNTPRYALQGPPPASRTTVRRSYRPGRTTTSRSRRVAAASRRRSSRSRTLSSTRSSRLAYRSGRRRR
jgi:N-acetylmuramoyl-L-alanine amidase